MTKRQINSYANEIYQHELILQSSTDKEELRKSKARIIEITNIISKDFMAFMEVNEILETKFKNIKAKEIS